MMANVPPKAAEVDMANVLPEEVRSYLRQLDILPGGTVPTAENGMAIVARGESNDYVWIPEAWSIPVGWEEGGGLPLGNLLLPMPSLSISSFKIIPVTAIPPVFRDRPDEWKILPLRVPDSIWESAEEPAAPSAEEPAAPSAAELPAAGSSAAPATWGPDVPSVVCRTADGRFYVLLSPPRDVAASPYRLGGPGPDEPEFRQLVLPEKTLRLARWVSEAAIAPNGFAPIPVVTEAEWKAGHSLLPRSWRAARERWPA
jgi:hypothetical protein